MTNGIVEVFKLGELFLKNLVAGILSCEHVQLTQFSWHKYRHSCYDLNAMANGRVILNSTYL